MNLDGVRVLDLTQLLPGPYGSQLLADMGAEVLKVEPLTGDPARQVQGGDGWAGHVFSAVNSGKRSIAIDLKTAAGQGLFHDLVSEFDVVFEQFRPGVTARLGVDYETLTEHRENIVHCSLTGYGQTGPDRHRAGHDLNYAGVAGLLDMTRPRPAAGRSADRAGDEHSGRGSESSGEGERVERAPAPPTLPGYPVADMTGGVMAVTAILGALLERELGGGGAHLDVSMTEALLSYGQVELAMADDESGEDPVAGGTPPSGSAPWYGVYETADGRAVTLAALEPRFFRAFCEAVDRPELFRYHLTRDADERDRLRSELEHLFAGRTRSEWLDVLGDDTMVGPVNTAAEALADPHLRERGVFTETSVGHRRVRPSALSTETDDDGPVPALGEHTDEVLAEHGFDAATVAELREDGVVR